VGPTAGGNGNVQHFLNFPRGFNPGDRTLGSPAFFWPPLKKKKWGGGGGGWGGVW